MKAKLITLFMGVSLCLSVSAQHRHTNPAVSSSSVDYYMEKYNFDEAEKQLERNIKMLKRKRQSTDEAEKQLDKIDMARSMLQATERVLFVDSFVVDKKNFLKAMKISRESGTVQSFTEFFGKPDTTQSTVYLSELGDKIYYARSEKGKLRLYTSDLLGGKWSGGQPLRGLNEDEAQNYPFMLSDGVTLYYAAQGDESLGGYDIFVTRYDADSREFLKPENIGMPFNSPANDYMYAIDEINNLGWFASDRSQPEGKVCIYVFVPNPLRKLYDTSAYDEEEMCALARISSIAATWGDTELLTAGRQRLEAALNEEEQVVVKKDFDFVINNQITYTLVAEFRSAEAQKMAQRWKDAQAEYDKNKQTLQQLRDAYVAGNAARKKQLSQQILTMEQACEKLYLGLKEQEVKIRNTELLYLSKK